MIQNFFQSQINIISLLRLNYVCFRKSLLSFLFVSLILYFFLLFYGSHFSYYCFDIKSCKILSIISGPAIGALLYDLGGFKLPFFVVGSFGMVVATGLLLIIPTVQVSISPTCYEQLFHMKVFCAAFLYYQLN